MFHTIDQECHVDTSFNCYVQSKQGFYYPVNFGLNNHLRKYFAPMNGEIKPDSEEVRLLLRDSGWLDDGALTGNSSSSS